MKRKIISTLLVLLLLMTTFVPTIKATLEGDKKDIQDKIDEANDKKDEVVSEKKTALEEISDLEDSIAKYESELASLNTEITKLGRTIKTKTEEIEKLQKDYEKRKQLLQDRLVAVYEEGEITFLDVLLASNDIWDYISMNARIEEMAKADNEQMDELEAKRKEVEKAKRELEEEKTKLDNARKSVDAKQKDLKIAKASKESKVAALSAEEKKIQTELEKYKKELQDIEKRIAAAAANASGVYNGSFSGTLGWPVSSSSSYYNVISSRFGSRTSPVAGASSNHRGIDIPVSEGTPVYAAADGYVVTTMRTGARGVFVLIKHADDLYTRYQHLSRSAVSEGQYVKRAQVIAYSGSTGIGSGPHLHFEVLRTPYYMTEIDPLNCGLLSKPSNLVIW